MAEHTHGQLLELQIADSPDDWSAAGFAVDDSCVWMDGVAIRLVDIANEEPEASRGIRGWALHGVAGDLDGLTSVPPYRSTTDRSLNLTHPNGVSSIDHVVVQTDDFTRTLPAFHSAGLDLRRTRTFDFGGSAQQQCFFWLGSTILELVGPQIPAEEPGNRASFWGLALTCPDLDASAEYLGDLTTPVKPAVQRGRFISTLKTRDLDISLPIALMSPHVSSGAAGG